MNFLHIKVMCHTQDSLVQFKAHCDMLNYLLTFLVLISPFYNFLIRFVSSVFLSFLVELFFGKKIELLSFLRTLPLLMLLPSINFNIDHNLFGYRCIVFILCHNNTCDKTFMTLMTLNFRYLNIGLFWSIFAIFCMYNFLIFRFV